ncbi:hypothetical protein PR002_g5678 [Phytophthora rubi]|uniref:Uncharacterized protein n=1 Tax=Phytophthora rubi TaxID=129364 RepID=A0A6A3NDN4_9STRA|nr:hypothetical protein PR002_g5678 [Phytophthora rubi]
MAYPSADLPEAMQQQMAAVNSAEVALGNTIFRAIEACKSAAEAAQRIYDVIGPVKNAVDAISTSVGHDQFNYWIDTATFTHLTNSTDAMPCK